MRNLEVENEEGSGDSEDPVADGFTVYRALGFRLLRRGGAPAADLLRPVLQ